MKFFIPTFPNGAYLKPALLLLVSAAVTLPVFYFGIPTGNDLPQHYQFALTFYENIQHGNFYPGWSAATNAGFGDVGIRFYPPFSYYVLVAFRFLAGNWYEASVLAFWFWFLAGAAGVYFWAREWFGENSSLFAAVLYTLMPYHVNQLYNAFTYAEFAASAVLPFCFLFTTRICRNGKLLDIVGLSVFYALLALTHLPMTVIGSLGLLVYSLACLEKKNIPSVLTKLALSVFFGLLASAFYWARMIGEMDFVKHTTNEFISNAYDFHNNFLAGFRYISHADDSGRLLWFADLMLLITLAPVVPSAVLYFYKIKGTEKPKLFNVAALLLFGVFISTPLSLFVWEHFHLLQKVQFPWRAMTIISLSGAIIAAAGYEYLTGLFRSKLRPLALIIIGLTIACAVFTATQVIKPANYMSRQAFSELIKKLPEAPSCDCWMAVWSEKKALADNERVSIENRKVEIAVWDATARIFQVGEGRSQAARVASFYYPNWQADVNGKEVKIGMDKNGAILIPLPSEEAEVKLLFRESLFVRTAACFSIACWLFFAVFGGIALLRNRRPKVLNRNLPVI